MSHLIYLSLLVLGLVEVSVQQCDRTEFNVNNQVLSTVISNHNQTITINSIYYNCLSLSQIDGLYSSMSVSILYIRSDDPNNTREVHYNLQCKKSKWEIVGDQSTAQRNNNTRYCEDCSVNDHNCTG